jgi:hypothetical protein
VELLLCAVTVRLFSRTTGRFHPLRIRHAARIACSEPSNSVQSVQLDQYIRLASGTASASHAEGRWLESAATSPTGAFFLVKGNRSTLSQSWTRADIGAASSGRSLARTEVSRKYGIDGLRITSVYTPCP